MMKLLVTLILVIVALCLFVGVPMVEAGYLYPKYIAVVHPLKPRMTKHQVLFIIVLVWTFAGLLSLPNLLYSKLFTIPFEDGGYRVVCMLVWPDGYAGQSTSDYLYNLTFLMITYVIPMISLVITYSLMSRVLWGSKGIGEETDIQRESIRSKQKVARMLIALVILFAICWLPYHAYFLYSYHYPHVNQSVIIQHIFLFSYWLAMSNSMYNPLIYYWMNKRFRSYFASIFCFLARNRLKKQSSYNVKTDLSSNGFNQHHGTTASIGHHYRRAIVQTSNHFELHPRANSNNNSDHQADPSTYLNQTSNDYANNNGENTNRISNINKNNNNNQRRKGSPSESSIINYNNNSNNNQPYPPPTSTVGQSTNGYLSQSNQLNSTSSSCSPLLLNNIYSGLLPDESTERDNSFNYGHSLVSGPSQSTNDESVKINTGVNVTNAHECNQLLTC